MAITGPSSYIPTMNEFVAHWALCNLALAPASLLVRQLNNTTLSQPQFVTLRDTLQTQQNTIQACLNAQMISRGVINLKKAAFVEQFALFTSLLDGYYQNTEFYGARPLAPGFGVGQENFTRPLSDMMSLWEKLNAGPAPAGVTLPLVLPDGTSQGVFASAVSSLQFTYAEERRKAQDVAVARARRDLIMEQAYDVMKIYREVVPGKLVAHPELVATLPRLSPVPGHTPQAVNASAVFQAPDATRVVYEESNDGMLARYELRGHVGEEYHEEDAVVIASRLPEQTREFVTTFGLTQPGAQVALKVYVVLTTDNEAGSAAMIVQRPALFLPLAA